MFNLLSWKEINSKEHKAKIAKRLHDERKFRGFTLNKLIELSGFSKPTVQSWEKGWQDSTGENKIPSLEQLYFLSQLYESSFEYLLCISAEKTKPLTDICRETGLTEQSVNILRECFSYELTHPSIPFEFEPPAKYTPNSIMLLADWRIDTFAFLNFFIEHYDKLGHQLAVRRPIELLTKNLNEMSKEQKNDLMNGFCYIHNKLGDDAYNSYDPLSGMLAASALSEYYHSLGYDLEKTSELTSLVEQYYYVLCPTTQKRSDFEISDTFMDIIKSFYSSFSEHINSYQCFVEKHIDPSKIQFNYNIIRADESEDDT